MKFKGQLTDFVVKIKSWALALGFSDLRIADIDPGRAETKLNDWLANNYHGEMDYMAAHGIKRSRPDELMPGTMRVITVRMNYLASDVMEWKRQESGKQSDFLAGRISLYARGRDYHKVVRLRLQKLVQKIQQEIGPFRYRVFADSAPVMEVVFAQKAGLGWRGKNNLLLNRQAGSFFFLGEIFVDLSLPIDNPVEEHCGHCLRCIQCCPTGAIVSPYKMDARRCISYLTIELKGSIPVEFRSLIGNRIYGCDDCQLCCPWNKFAQKTIIPDFGIRHNLDKAMLLDLFAWTELEFNKKTEGSPIRRIGYERWMRNISVALGNALGNLNNQDDKARISSILNKKKEQASEIVIEHIDWALSQNRQKTEQ